MDDEVQKLAYFSLKLALCHGWAPFVYIVKIKMKNYSEYIIIKDPRRGKWFFKKKNTLTPKKCLCILYLS
jgi:hypothetical protein